MDRKTAGGPSGLKSLGTDVKRRPGVADTRIARPAGAGWAGVLAGFVIVVTLASAPSTSAQQPEGTDRPQPKTTTPRARVLLRTAIDHYKLEDYELAAKVFAQVQGSQSELSQLERDDLK